MMTMSLDYDTDILRFENALDAPESFAERPS
jgi:hypothetical protein